MKMWSQYKKLMPTNEMLVRSACHSMLDNLDSDAIKKSFSSLVKKLSDQVYTDYLTSEEKVYDKLILRHFSDVQPSFSQLNDFFLSLSQSRKSRAGKAFEMILEELLSKRLGYPMARQVDIEGAKPDFVLPSKQYFERVPIDCMLLTAKRTLGSVGDKWLRKLIKPTHTFWQQLMKK